jgi:hypothetical protein
MAVGQLRPCGLSEKEETLMEKINNSIKCSVCECAHHAQAQNYCTLNEINVGCCSPKATSCDCTECASFAKNAK